MPPGEFYEKCLLSGFGVAGVDGGHPNGFLVVVDAVPDAGTGGDLVLPLG